MYVTNSAASPLRTFSHLEPAGGGSSAASVEPSLAKITEPSVAYTRSVWISDGISARARSEARALGPGGSPGGVAAAASEKTERSGPVNSREALDAAASCSRSATTCRLATTASAPIRQTSTKLSAAKRRYNDRVEPPNPTSVPVSPPSTSLQISASSPRGSRSVILEPSAQFRALSAAPTAGADAPASIESHGIEAERPAPHRRRHGIGHHRVLRRRRLHLRRRRRRRHPRRPRPRRHRRLAVHPLIPSRRGQGLGRADRRAPPPAPHIRDGPPRLCRELPPALLPLQDRALLSPR